MHLAEIRSKIESWQHVRRPPIMWEEGVGGWMLKFSQTNSLSSQTITYRPVRKHVLNFATFLILYYEVKFD